jgi:hypothetical protein
MSPCSSDYIFPKLSLEARRVVSEGSTTIVATSLLIVRTGRIVTASRKEASSAGFSEFPAYSQVLLKLAILEP